MSRFYLVRHAKAEKQAKGSDALRPLTAEGRNAFAAHVHHHARDLRVLRILTSPYLRARETADVLAGATGAPVEEDEALASGASGGRDLLRLGAKLGAGVALVGHNPEIAQAVALAADRDVEVKPGTIAAVDSEKGVFRLAWMRPVS
jgi:phosphohistidine phosphatase